MKLIILMSLLTITGYSVQALSTTTNKTTNVPNLSNIILKQYPARGGHDYDEFYANSVELEPFTLILCGKKVVDQTTHKVTYTKVDPSALSQISFYVNSNVVLDQKTDPNNTIPIIQNNSTNTDIYKPDPSEPVFDYNTSKTTRALLIYAENSHYYQVYKKLGYQIGEVDGSPTYLSYLYRHSQQNLPASASDENACFPNDNVDPTTGTTVIHLYLLASGALNNTPLLKVSARANDDSGNSVTQGPMTFSIPETPILSVKDFNATTERIGTGLNNPARFYSYFSKHEVNNGVDYLQEERGLVSCRVSATAPFHNLYYYTDNPQLCRANTPNVGASDCNEHNCARQFNYTSISSLKTLIHDMGSTDLYLGTTCPNRSGAFTAGFYAKPVFNSSDQTVNDQSNNFYISYLGGVGAHFYRRSNDKDDYVQKSSVQGYGGLNNHFYYMTYTFGITPDPGGKCSWKRSLLATGHDIFGNNIGIQFVPANGDDDPKIISVSS